MSAIRFIARGSCLISLIALLSGCIIAPDHDRGGYDRGGPREGYYDRDHHRYYRDHEWHECHEHDSYCR